ncbi:hypothetical protein K6025_04885 [Ehrlichia sp. JZT12]
MGYNNIFLIISALVLACLVVLLIYLFYRFIRLHSRKRGPDLTTEDILSQLVKDVERLQAGEIERLYLLEEEYKSSMRDVRKIQDNIYGIEDGIQINAASIKILQQDLRNFSDSITSWLVKNVERLQAGEIERLYLLEEEYKSSMRDVRKIQDNIYDIEDGIQRNAAGIKILQQDLRNFSDSVTSCLEVLDTKVINLIEGLSK